MLENSPPASTENWDRSNGFPWQRGWNKSLMTHIKYGQSLEILSPWLSGTRERNGSESWNIKQDAKHARTVISSGINRRIDDISLHQTHLSRFHAEILRCIQLCLMKIRFRLVECHASRKIHFKSPKIIFSKNPGVTNYIVFSVLTKGERVCLVRWMLFSHYKIMLPLIIAFRTCGGS